MLTFGDDKINTLWEKMKGSASVENIQSIQQSLFYWQDPNPHMGYVAVVIYNSILIFSD